MAAFRPWGRRSALWGSLVLLLGLGAAFLVWQLRTSSPPPPPDMLAVLRAHHRGVGLIEQFRYAEAVTAFAEAHALAPDWPPGQINLGVALLNLARGQQGAAKDATLQRAHALFEQALAADPDNPHAHFCLGLLLFDAQTNWQEAAPHFERVTQLDPQDAHAWYWLGKSLVEDERRALVCFRRAVDLNPYLSGALENLWSLTRRYHPEQAEALLAEKEALRAAEWLEPVDARFYTDLGRYAQVIGRPLPGSSVQTGPIPVFTRADNCRIQLAPGARWATAHDLGKDAVGELQIRVRARFGATMVVLDYNRDGRPDLFLLAAVVENGRVRDLLLRNEGGGRFTDVTTEAGLAGSRPGLGCCVADIDNDGYPDLLITGVGEQHLFRNDGAGRFADVTAKVGLGDLRTVCLGAAFVDLDQDGDLDLVVAQYAATAAEALAQLAGNGPPRGPGLAVFVNIGEAPPLLGNGRAGTEPLLQPRFRRIHEEMTALPGVVVPSPAKAVLAAAEAVARSRLPGPGVPAVGVAVADFDLDRDLDLLILADRTPPALVLNDRLLRFHRRDIGEAPVKVGRWNGALVLDANHDGRSDLFVVGPDQPPRLLLNRTAAGRWFEAGPIDAPPLLQAQAVDVDLDGWTDVVGLSAERRPVLLHNDGRGLVHVAEGLGRELDWPPDLVAVTAADFDGDGFPDIMVWSEAAGLQLLHNRGNSNHALPILLTGRRGVEGQGTKVRSNADGFGTWVIAQADDLWTGAEVTTLSAGLGQSSQPLLLGLGRHLQADVVRLRWPDGVWQAELHQPAGPPWHLAEKNRKDVCCPILFAWDGRRFGFVTDFLGAGSLGEPLPGGGHRPPRSEEAVKIEPEQLAPLEGSYVLKIDEPMDEVTYLDRLQLVVLDHPEAIRVYPDERFPAGDMPPTQDLLALGEAIAPLRARDHHGRDVTHILAAWDRLTVDDFARRSWLGLAEEHSVELDFGDRLARFAPHDRLFLCLAGWTDYPYPESIWAAAQAGIVPQGPTLECLGQDGQWQTLVAETGFPAGLPRMMTLEVTGMLRGPRCVLRLRTNLEVYWDQITVAPLLGAVAADHRVRATVLEPGTATLSARGCMQEFSPDGRMPTLYDYDKLDAVPVSRLSGRVTRFGDVTELLRDRDDRFVIFGPGDELTVRFDARDLPALPSGWKRSFVLRTWGYCKDCSPFTTTGDAVEPLPFHAMGNYPPDRPYPRDAVHDDYRKRFNTRSVGAARSHK